MKRAIKLVSLAGVAVALAACSITVVPPGPPANTINVTANLNPFTALHTLNAFNPGQSQVFRVTVPASVANNDLIYIELNRDIELEVLPSAFTSVIYSANSSASFSSGRFGIQSASADGAAAIEDQTVTTQVSCRGSCVLVRGNSISDPFYVRVRNDGGSATTVSLFAYGEAFADTTETINGAIATAPSLITSDSGAIETVGDFDLWFVAFTGTIAFDTVANGPQLEAHVLDVNGVPIPSGQGGGPFFHGQTFSVFSNEYVRVRAVSGVQAAASARSTYFLQNLSSAGR